MIGGCGSSVTTDLKVEEEDHAIITTLQWTYDDWSVDISVTLSTAISLEDGGCETSGRLVVDKITSFKDIAELDRTPCEELMVTEDGDIIMLTEGTAMSWIEEVLAVNKDDRRLRLGPVRSGDSSDYSFVLEAQPCSDDPFCDCAVLFRHRDDEVSELDLGRDCDKPYGG